MVHQCDCIVTSGQRMALWNQQGHFGRRVPSPAVVFAVITLTIAHQMHFLGKDFALEEKLAAE